MVFEPITLVDGVEIFVGVVAHVEAHKKTPVLHSSRVVFHGGLDVGLDESQLCNVGTRNTV